MPSSRNLSGLSSRSRSQGFTLIEALIALGLAVTLAMFVMQSLAPWLNFRQRMENDRRLQLARTAIESAYAGGLVQVDAVADPVLTVKDGTAPPVTYASATTVAGGQCTGMTPSAEGVSAHLIPKAAGVGQDDFDLDGYNQPWCFFASNRLSVTRAGLPVNYHVFALVSAGRNGKLDPGTRFDQAAGTLDLGGDDRGVVIDGRALEEKAFEATQAKLSKVTKAYETYFTSRFLANPSRDVTVDYFTDASDASGVIPSTAGVFASADTTLSALSLGPDDYMTPYGPIEIGNFDECVVSPGNLHPDICAQSPKNSDRLPWTSVLRVEMPGGEYLSTVAVGGY